MIPGTLPTAVAVSQVNPGTALSSFTVLFAASIDFTSSVPGYGSHGERAIIFARMHICYCMINDTTTVDNTWIPKHSTVLRLPCTLHPTTTVVNNYNEDY